MKQVSKNCAIYCRKSTDEGLDMDFNTLDAQREACEAYITSQRAEGWKVIKTKYQDGGYSGGNMERPALQQLLADIKDGKVDIVVVYKIDRLTRSLMDFAKLVEIFDEHEVTFVSVTQSFNTTTSMGRLTLNVLLSFAQFEREVSAERIRDKFAASKKKGMWMGGNPPIGYEVKDRKLFINKEGAKMARHLFDRYLALGCVAKLKQELDAKGIVSAVRISTRGNKLGGKPYSRGALYSILKNPIYIGKIRHKEKLYDGQHESIIDQETWEKVQQLLSDGNNLAQGHKKMPQTNLLKGLLFDIDGTPYSPVAAKKNETKSYRYYVSQNLLQYRDHPKGIMARLPAHEIEQTVSNVLKNEIIQILKLDMIKDERLIRYIADNCPSADHLVHESVTKVVVDKGDLNIDICVTKLRKFLEKQLSLAIPVKSEDSCVINVPFTTRRAYKGAIVITPENAEEPDPLDLPPQQLKNLIRGIVWRDEHFAGMSMKAIAEREGLSKAGVQKIIMGSFDTLMSL